MAIGIGLIGLGRIGRLHAANLAAHPLFELRCVFDVDADACRAVAAEHGAAVAGSLDAVFADDALEAVFVASATATHCDFIERGVAAGKAVLCEKPLDLDIARVRRSAAVLADAPDAVVQIGFNRRFDPGHAAVLRRVREGEIGALEKLVITSRDPDLPSTEYLRASGGLFRDMMIHDFDIARAALPDEPVRVAAAGAALVSPDACAAAKDVDTAMVLLQTAGGALCHINCSRRAVYGYDQRIEAFGAEGMLLSGNRTATQVESFARAFTGRRDPLQNFFIDRYVDSYRLQLDAFAAAVRGESPAPAPPTFDDGMKALLLADAAQRALDTGSWQEVERA